MTVLLGANFKVPYDLDKWQYFHKILKMRIYTEFSEYDLKWKLIDYTPLRITKKTKGKKITEMTSREIIGYSAIDFLNSSRYEQ